MYRYQWFGQATLGAGLNAAHDGFIELSNHTDTPLPNRDYLLFHACITRILCLSDAGKSIRAASKDYSIHIASHVDDIACALAVMQSMYFISFSLLVFADAL